MKERPILFSAPMVRALLAGEKTQTRRIMKPQPPRGLYNYKGSGNWLTCDEGGVSHGPYHCPYGQPGDRLWVRETWQADPPIDDSWASTQWHGCKNAAVSEIPERFRHARYALHRADWLHGDILWRPSIFMPRWASRITLEITEVRVERLHDISEADAKAEGITQQQTTGWFSVQGINGAGTTARSAYALLWNSINGSGSWDTNPWVWVVSFVRKRAEAAA